MFLIDEITKLITERGSAAVLRERLALLKDQMEATANEIEALKKENARLVEENGNFRKQVETRSTEEQFVEERGVLFKKKPRGGYHKSAYCPRCKMAMASGFPGFSIECVPCGHISQIYNHEVEEIVRSLP